MKTTITKIILLGCILLMSACSDKTKNILTNLKTEVDTQHINFRYKTLDSVLTKSKIEQKKIFMYITSDGCGPCVKMEKNVFPDSLVTSYINVNFICAKSHIKRTSNSPHITKLDEEVNKTQYAFNEKYKIYGYPTFIVINSKGELIHKTTGYKTSNELIQFGKDALSTDKNYAAIKTKIKKGDYSFNLVKPYLESLSLNKTVWEIAFGSEKDKIVKKYFKTQQEVDLASKDNWYIINRYVEDFDSEQFQYLLNNQEQYYKSFDKTKVDYKIWRILANYEYNGGDISNLKCDQAKSILRYNLLKKQQYSDLNLSTKDFDVIYTNYYRILEYEINNKAREVYDAFKQENTTITKETIKKAENWMRLLVNIRPDFTNYKDTFEKLKSL